MPDENNNYMNLKLHTTSKMFYAFLMTLFSVWGWGQVSITSLPQTYNQDFNGLSSSSTSWTNNSTLTGWYISSTSLTLYTATSNSNSCYNTGNTSSSDRSIGALSTSSNSHYFGIRIKNNSGQAISSLTLSFTGEQWRQNDPGTLVFSYRVSSSAITDLTSGTYTNASTFNFSSINNGTASGIDGNDSSNRLNINNTLSVNIPAGSEIMLKWLKSGSNSAILSLDDISITANPACSAPSTPAGTISGATPACTSTVLTYNPSAGENAANLYWQTSSTGTSTNSSANNNLNVTSSGTYYVKAYNGTCWSAASTGYSVTINSTINAAVITNSASAISYSTATFNGNLTTLGVCPATVERGFVYGTVSGSYGAQIAVGTSLTTGSFTSNLSSLSAGTTYYYKAYAKDANGIYIYGSEQTFTTLIPATQIVFVNVPSSGYVNSNLAAFSVQARTSNNTIDTNYLGSVSINKLTGAGIMSGTTSNVNFVNGVAVFNDVKFDVADNYTISAVSGSFPTITSGTITISNAPVAIAGWDFENTTITGTGNTPNVNPVSANFGLITTGTVFSGYHSSSSTWSTGTGNGSTKAATVPNWNNGDYWQIKFVTTGYKNIRLKISQRGSNTGPRDFKLQYSTDGILFTDLTGGNYSIVNDSWLSSSTVAGSVRIFDFDTVSLLNNKSQVFIRIVNSSDTSINNGSVASTGTSFIDDITVEGLPFPTTIWSTSWSNGVPNNETNVIINSEYSTNNQPSFTANNITIKNGGVLEVNGTNTINAADVTVEDGGNLIIKDSGVLNQTGSFKVLKNSASPQGKYVFWSSPVANQNLFTAYSNGSSSTAPLYVMSYDPATNLYPMVANDNANFTNNAGKGYSVKVPAANASLVFGGASQVPNNGTINVSLSNAGNGYNLIGNPYPSNVSLTDFYTANNSAIEPTLWFWDNTTGNVTTQTGNTSVNVGFATFNAQSGTWTEAPNTQSYGSAALNSLGSFAKIGQGFIVKSINAAPAAFTNAMRSSAAAVTMNKNINTAEGKYWIKLTTSYGNTVTQAVTYSQAASDAYDGYDSRAMGMGSDAFYSLAGTEKLVIQGRAPFQINDVVPLGNKHFENGNFIISLSHKEGLFTNGQPIYLHDKQNGTYTNLQSGNYNFAENAGDFTNRFEIVYKLNVLSTKETEKAAFEVYRDGEDFVVRNHNPIQSVEVFDAAGRKIQQMTTNSKSVIVKIPAKGLYILKAVSEGKQFTQKIIN